MTVRWLAPSATEAQETIPLNFESESESCLGHFGGPRVDFLISSLLHTVTSFACSHACIIHRMELVNSALCSGQLSWSQEGKATGDPCQSHVLEAGLSLQSSWEKYLRSKDKFPSKLHSNPWAAFWKVAPPLGSASEQRVGNWGQLTALLQVPFSKVSNYSPCITDGEAESYQDNLPQAGTQEELSLCRSSVERYPVFTFALRGLLVQLETSGLLDDVFLSSHWISLLFTLWNAK